MSSHDIAAKAAHELTMALTKPHPAAQFFPPNAQQNASLQELATIFSEMANPKQNHQCTDPLPPPRVPHLTSKAFANTAIHNKQPAHLAEVIVPMPDVPLQRANALFDPSSGKNLEYRQLIWHPTFSETWLKSSANEFGRLAQGIRNITGTDTITFITKNDIPQGRTVTYGRFVCDIQPQKAEPARTRLTVGGNLITYPGNDRAPTGSLTTYKLHINDVVSTPNAKR